jgi:hypothetical protein
MTEMKPSSSLEFHRKQAHHLYHRRFGRGIHPSHIIYVNLSGQDGSWICFSKPTNCFLPAPI